MSQAKFNQSNKIAVVGGGAAGLFAASKALENGAIVTVFERNVSFGQKLNLTGNGKCNFTNYDLDDSHFRNSEYIQPFLDKYNASYFQDYFLSLGVLSYSKKNGCLYPSSQKATTITQSLVRHIEQLGGKMISGVCISEIIQNNSHKFELITKEQKIDDVFDCVILACGGKAAPKTGSDGFGFRLARTFGHTVSRTYPVLVQLKSDSGICKKCSGVRCRVNASAYINNELLRTEHGELQITDSGLSGIVIFQLSRILSKAVEEGKVCEIIVDFLPELSEHDFTDFLNKRLNMSVNDTFYSFFEGLGNPKLIKCLLNELEIDSERIINKDDFDCLISVLFALKKWKFTITGHNGYDNAQATRGGVLLNEISPNMESVFTPGLYFAGEMLDVDADCGGYNLHWAWTSGEVAGISAAKKGF